MADDEVKKRAAFFTDWLVKVHSLLALPDHLVRLVLDVEYNPSPENFAKIERCIAEAQDALSRKGARVPCQPSQPQFFPKFLN